MKSTRKRIPIRIKIWKFFLNQPYFTLYPISEMPEIKQYALIEAFNNCDLIEDNETTMLLSSLYSYALDKVTTKRIQKESIERNLGFSYKTKKVKKGNKETGGKETDQVTVEKNGNKQIIERFQRLQEENIKSTERYENLIQAIENRTLTKEHLSLFDELLMDNKYKKWMYIVYTVAVIAIPILIFILAKVFNI